MDFDNQPVIIEITEKDFNPDYSFDPNRKYDVRKAARAILKYNDKVALLNVTSKNYHKLPGGGVELGESLEKALKREILEETGCDCEIEKELGVTIEYRDKFNVLQTSYIFIAHVVGEPNVPEFTKEEEENGFKIEWFSLEEVEDIMKNDEPMDYVGKFISLRDKKIINFYKTH